jgi:hypothetical protein
VGNDDTFGVAPDRADGTELIESARAYSYLDDGELREICYNGV